MVVWFCNSMTWMWHYLYACPFWWNRYICIHYPYCICAADNLKCSLLYLFILYRIVLWNWWKSVPLISQILLNPNSALPFTHSTFQMLSVMCIDSAYTPHISQSMLKTEENIASNSIPVWQQSIEKHFLAVLWKRIEKLYTTWACREPPLSLLSRRAFIMQ